jgi:glutamate synthase domain-containing protein 1
VDLPALGRYATGICFADRATNGDCERQFAELAKECGLQVVCWRDVPVDSSKIGQMARSSEPLMRQVFLSGTATDEALNRQVGFTQPSLFKSPPPLFLMDHYQRRVRRLQSLRSIRVTQVWA